VDVKVDAPQFLVGTGAVELLAHAPNQLIFSNGEDKDALIEILIGRDATT
jgi:hypothetical protein